MLNLKESTKKRCLRKDVVKYNIVRSNLKFGLSFIMLALYLNAQSLYSNTIEIQTIEEVSVTLEFRNVSLLEAFRKIEATTPFYFMYNEKDVKNVFNLNIPAAKQPLKVVLDRLLANTNLAYKQVNNHILIMPKDQDGIIVKGVVTDKDGVPMPGVNVVLDGSSSGTMTDFDGNYTLNAPADGVLIFSYLGYVRQEVPVNSRSTINVILQEDITSLDEVVVTALGIKQQARSLVYATQTVEPEGMTEVRDPNNIINSFQGKIANALITQSNGGVGTDAGIILRGNRSIQGSNNALIVVDGVPSLNGSTANINPDDIESITVLRGASAGALYGSEAGNGVIVITTKMGTKDEVSVDLNMGTVVNTPIGLPRLQNQYGQGSGGVIDGNLGTSWGALMQGQEYTNYKGELDTYSPQPDNVRDFFQTGISSNNSIRVAGGTEKLQNYFSYTNVNTKGIVPSNDLKSHTINLRLNTQVSESFSIDAKATYFRRHIDNKLTGAANNPVIRAHQIARNIPLSMVKDFMTTENGVPAPLFWASTDNLSYQNPYWTLFGNRIEERADRLTGYIKGTIKLTDWLNLLGNLSMEKSFGREDLRVKQGVYFNPARAGGTYEVTKTQSEQHWFDVMLDGTNEIAKNLSVNYQAGAIYRNNNFNRDVSTASGLNVANKFSLNFASSSILSSTASQVQTQSLFGQFNLSYKNALFLNGSIRKDWTSLLPPPHSFEYYSFGSSVILSDIFKLPTPISYLKASANYAEVGNGGQFGLLASTYEYSPGAGNGYLRRNSVLPFPGLLPEIVKNTELGLESRFFQNRLRFSFTYYQSNSFNQLLSVSLPPATGFSSKYINAGNIRNRGFELVFGATPVKGEDFMWDLDFNLGMNKNKVLELDEDLKVIYLIGGQNSSSNQIQVKEGGEYGDVTTNYWAVNENGEYLVNAEGLPISSNQRGELGKVIGNFNPDALMGLSNSFTYKNLSLRVLLDGRVGGIVISSLEQDRVFDGALDFTTQYRDGGWNLGGVDVDGNPVNETVTAQEFWQTVSSKRQGVGEFFTYDATNFRMREVALGYNFPLKDDFAIKSINLSLVARNLFWIYRGSAQLDIPGLKERKMWFDPDYASGGIQSSFGGIPATRTVGLNLSLSF